MNNRPSKLKWTPEFSVGVEIIDKQHQHLFMIINESIDTINKNPDKDTLDHIIKSLLEYRTFHFATEEHYFKEFNYDKAEEHIAMHNEFGVKIAEIQERCGDDIVKLSIEVVDFLEDWLVYHVLTEDKKYMSCFNAHGLK